MPISAYFNRHGEEVMARMRKEYGAKKGKQVFYATANKRKETALGKELKKYGKRRKKRE